MAQYEINQTVNYSGIVDADNRSQAIAIFLKDQESFYCGVESEDITLLDEEYN